MIEDEINLWFEDKKEILLKLYLKRMDSLMIEEDPQKSGNEENGKKEEKKKEKQVKKDVEEKKRLMLIYEEESLEKSKQIRDKYDAMIYKERQRINNKELNKKKINKILTPLLKLWNLAKRGFIAAKEDFKSKKKDFDVFYFDNIKSKNLRKKEQKKFKFGRRIYPYKVFYKQHIWPILHFLNTPNRILKVKILKLLETLKLLFSKTTKKTKEILDKIIKAITAFFKAIFGFIGKVIAKIKDIIKKMAEFLKKLIDIIRIKFFNKKDE
jgi:hypothetical protein